MPSGKRGLFTKDTTVLDAARSLGVDLDSVCGGRAICGRCQIEVSEGEFAKLAISSKKSHISSFNLSEEKYSKRKSLDNKRRLGCQSKIINDIVIDVPPESQLHQQIVRKEFEAIDIIINPGAKNSTVLIKESVKNVRRKTLSEKYEAKVKAAEAQKGKKK